MRVQAAVFVSLLLAPAGLAQPCVARLMLRTANTLPGIPVGLTITVADDGPHSFSRPEAVRLEERRGSGDEWHTVSYASSDHAPLSREDDDKPAGDRTWSFDPVWMEDAGWFWDRRLSEPGVHELRAAVLSKPSVSEALCFSAPVRMTVDDVHDDDAKVWKFMNALLPKSGWSAKYARTYGTRIVEFIAQSAPSSRYLLPFAVYAFASSQLYSPQEGERGTPFALADRAIAIDPDSSRAQRLRIDRAIALVDVATYRAARGDIDGAMALHQKAVDELRALRAAADTRADTKVVGWIDLAAGQIGSREHMVAMSKSGVRDKH